MEPVYIYRATCERVIDGDTLVANVALGFCVSANITVRVRGVNTPELHGGTLGERNRAAQAKAFVQTLTAAPAVLTIQSYKDKQTFARWVCDVWLPDGRNLADVLIAEGHGVAA